MCGLYGYTSLEKGEGWRLISILGVFARPIASPWFPYCTLSEYFSPILHPKIDKIISVIRFGLHDHIRVILAYKCESTR